MNARRNPASSPRTYGSIDWWLLSIVAILLCLGLIMILSAGVPIKIEEVQGKYVFFKKQLMYGAIGLVLAAIVTRLPRNLLNSLHYPALALAFVLLFLCLTPLGGVVKGASRWIFIGNSSIQPVEFARVALVFYLAYFLSSHEALMLQTFSKGIIPPFAVAIGLCILLLLQPDFGSAFIMAALLFLMCFIGKTRKVYLGLIALLLAALGVILVMSSEYQMRRILGFLDPFNNAQDAGYQVVQSFLALANGGFFGMGIGNGIQKLRYLPEPHNDFIMAVVGEELGLLGITLVIILFALFFSRCYRIIIGQEEARDRLTALGLTLILALSFTFNLGVVLGMAPTKGIAMPFLSYGGSSLVATLLCVGLLLNYSRTMRS